MKKREAMRLVRALRSGKYTQGQHRLEHNGQFCCLGVACAISKKAKRACCSAHVSYDYKTQSLPASVADYFGFYDSLGARCDSECIVINNTTFFTLASANDSGCSFTDIANYIEANYKYL